MADDTTIKLTIDGKPYEIDVMDLELDEQGLIEDLGGGPIGSLDFNMAWPLKGLVFVLKRRKNPNVTLEDIGRIKVGQFVEPEVAAPPTKARAKTAGKK